MKTYTVDEMKEMLAEHAKWIRGEGGSRADLREANLSEANLSEANLSEADLSEAYLSGANLRGADLSGANLSEAYLSGANLRGANLRGANLSGANLSEADLSGANLRGANLSGANLSEANLSEANLSGANLSEADLRRANLSEADLRRANLSGANLSDVKYLPAFQICEGDLIAYKKVKGKIVTLSVPKDAKRTASIVGRKCRAEYAMVLEIEGHAPVTSNGRGNGIATLYEEGKEVRADSYDPDWRVECSHGIHFWLTRKEAEDFTA